MEPFLIGFTTVLVIEGVVRFGTPLLASALALMTRIL
jgi:uncharacterized protein YjeT (DUF2065 family)